ncbi:unnamed protein product [Rotaria sordida]|uniref:Uncharacterized protein n=1 Tax=Rotaria sordida TaxID=392033 RepID=A0A815WZP8_9BILA|nr:unnamed protein product [Rotaria sordida]CAF1552067.1 unnamed protein product [Rotaria sordida]
MKRSSNGIINSLDDSILERFCSYILPKIHYKIKWLDLEPLCMERILLVADYPNLHGLSLFNIERDTILRLFGVCTYVLTMCTNLLCLKFHPYSDIYVDFSERLSFESIKSASFFSSNLMELHINVDDFTDCLYLLDGRFQQLRTFYVDIRLFTPPSQAIINKKELIHLKCFSLTCGLEIMFYEESMVPLLHRMSNLEELFLNVSIGRSTPIKSFIDGNDLKIDIMSHMPKLNKFVFSIHSNLNVDDLTHLPSNEDIQRTFKGLEDYQIISYIHYFPDDCIGQCHMYSQPYTMNYLYRLTNSFPGGLFKFVHKVSLYDEHPFEHEFFIRIAQSFPLLRTLSIDNESPQKHKQRQQLNKDRRSLPVIKYAHLTLLSLNSAHNDYIEQFLIHTKTCLSNYISLDVYYPSLQKVTNNFTRDTTRINCAKINYIYNIDKWNVSKHFHTYFPYVEKF